MRFIVAIALATIALGIASPREAVAQSGGYFGLTTGYGSGNVNQTGNLPPPPATAPPPVELCDGSPCDDAKYRARGGMIGGALGWNTKVGAWVWGLEGDYSYAAVQGDSSTCGSFLTSCGARLESLGTVRGKFGTQVNDWLLYATGGWAFGEVSGFSAAKSSGQAMYNGWTIGGGIEKRFAPQWSLKLEYLYTDLGGKDLYQASVPGFPEHVAYKLNTVRIGINYYFEPVSAPAPAPMITKGPPLK